MSSMPNVHVRDLPPETLESLRDAARRHRRSLNAELVAALVGHAERSVHEMDVLERLEEVRRIWRAAYPQGFPPGEEPETIIRRARDAR